MSRFQILVVFLFSTFATSLPGCTTFTANRFSRPVYLNTASHIDLNNVYLVKKRLYRQFKTWKGTPYKYGGLSRSGVDCSGFVYLTYRTQFGILLPRSTEEQIEIGRNVTGKQLKPGDLLFFSTGFSNHHVGIYVNGESFIHSSESHGVAISSLNNPYWISAFEEARRIR